MLPEERPHLNTITGTILFTETGTKIKYIVSIDDNGEYSAAAGISEPLSGDPAIEKLKENILTSIGAAMKQYEEVDRPGGVFCKRCGTKLGDSYEDVPMGYFYPGDGLCKDCYNKEEKENK